MVTIEICIGSSCYVKGSDSIVMLINDIIKTHHWEEKTEIKGSFCMGTCAQGIGVKVNGKQLHITEMETAEKWLTSEISEVL